MKHVECEKDITHQEIFASLQDILEAIQVFSTRMDQEITEIKTDIKELKTDVAGLKHDVAELKTDVAGLKHDVAELKTDVAELKHDVGILKVAVSSLQTDNIFFKSNMVTKDYLDQKMAEQKGDMIALIRKEDTKVMALTRELYRNKGIKKEQYHQIAIMEPFAEQKI